MILINYLFRKNNDFKKFFSFLFTFIFLILSISVVGFIFYKSFYFLSKKNINEIFNLFISSNWKPSKDNFGIFNFLISTFWTIFFSLILVIKINLFSSIFISKFLNKKIKKIVLFFLRVLSGVPSVLFGVFVLYSIGPILNKIPNGDSTSMLSAIIVLVMMALPTTIVLTVNAFDNVSKKHELSGLALGINKIIVIFDIVKKNCIQTIRIILFFCFCKIIGEVTAVSMVAGNGNMLPELDKGFAHFLFTSIRTLSTMIGLEFRENFNRMHESSLFFVSLILLIIVFISNIIFIFLNNNKFNSKKIFNSKKKFKFINNKFLFFKKINKKYNFNYYKNRFLIYYRKFNMYIYTFFIFFIFFWLLIDILWKGFWGFESYFTNNLFTDSLISGESGLLGIIISTLILIITTLLVTIPLALFTSIFISEYSFNSIILKKISKFIKFIVFQLSSIPTILFGMFGLTLFVTIFNFGFTILSGAFTMILIIFPIMVQIILQNLESIPKIYRYSGYALGLSQKVVIWKIIVPMALKGIFISIILGINKIISESSPLLIVMGNSTFEPNLGVFSDTRTLSTHIALMSSESPLSLEKTENIVYQTALTIFIIIMLLNFIINKLNNVKKYKIKK